MLAENAQNYSIQIITTESFFWGETKNLKKNFFFQFAITIRRTIWTINNILKMIYYKMFTIGNVKINCDMKQFLIWKVFSNQKIYFCTISYYHANQSSNLSLLNHYVPMMKGCL